MILRDIECFSTVLPSENNNIYYNVNVELYINETIDGHYRRPKRARGVFIDDN